MKLKVNEIPEEGLKLSFQEKEVNLATILRKRGESDIRFNFPLSIRLHITKSTEGVVFIKGAAFSSLVMQCARCLDDFENSLNLNLKYTLSPYSKEAAHTEEVELTRDDLEFVSYRGEEIDLLEIVLEEIVLSIPFKPICRKECRGLCPNCGINLNVDKCHCNNSQIDRRLLPLMKFKLKN